MNNNSKMNQWKSQLTCSYCAKIFKDPILLPCGDSICCQHLCKRDVVKANKIKCKKCNEEFQTKDNHFKSNEEFTDYIECAYHFSDKEINLHQERSRFDDSMNSTKNSFKINQNSNWMFSTISEKFDFKSMNTEKD